MPLKKTQKNLNSYPTWGGATTRETAFPAATCRTCIRNTPNIAMQTP